MCMGCLSEKLADVEECQCAEDGEDDGGNAVHQLHRYLLGDLVAQEHRRDVRQHHAEGRAEHHLHDVAVARGQRDSRDLRLVAHFGQKERHDGGAEDAEALLAPCGVVIDLVGDQHPAGHGQERQADDPAQDVWPQCLGDPPPHRACGGVVDQCGHQDAGNDGDGLAKRCGQHDGQ